ncbi:Hypothetical_protein [Hexamita inflata]|uniref:Hypothetical_protein n=1 Tax=Hexamita inflata TaxID=28002 RepID=A0AA86PWL6_9EUKA|nr:Hypothetical protein HINF_LOCUS30022 [Hexamita inflata]
MTQNQQQFLLIQIKLILNIYKQNTKQQVSVGEWDLFDVHHERSEDLWDHDSVFDRPVLGDAAEGSLGGGQGRVQHVDELPRLLGLELDVQVSGLVVEAVGAGHELSVALGGGEPGLEVELTAAWLFGLERILVSCIRCCVSIETQTSTFMLYVNMQRLLHLCS